MNRRRSSLPTVLAVLAVLGACADERTPQADAPPPAPSPSAESTAAAGPTPSPTVPATTAPTSSGLLAFRAPTVEGGNFDAAEVQGRDVAVWFWAPW